MNRLVLLPSTELVSDLYAVLGCCHGGNGKKEQGQKEESFHCLFSSASRNQRNMSRICFCPSTASAGHNFAHRIKGFPATVWNLGSPADGPSR